MSSAAKLGILVHRYSPSFERTLASGLAPLKWTLFLLFAFFMWHSVEGGYGGSARGYKRNYYGRGHLGYGGYADYGDYAAGYEGRGYHGHGGHYHHPQNRNHYGYGGHYHNHQGYGHGGHHYGHYPAYPTYYMYPTAYKKPYKARTLTGSLLAGLATGLALGLVQFPAMAAMGMGKRSVLEEDARASSALSDLLTAELREQDQMRRSDMLETGKEQLMATDHGRPGYANCPFVKHLCETPVTQWLQAKPEFLKPLPNLVRAPSSDTFHLKGSFLSAM